MTAPALLDHFAVAVSAVSGVIAARGKSLDLFGALVLALVTSSIILSLSAIRYRIALPVFESNRIL